MKKIFIVLILFSFSALAQETQKNSLNDSEENKEFLGFNIPASLNGSNLEPAGISNISTNFTESKASLKLGFPFKKLEDIDDTRFTFFLSGDIEATNGISTIWSTDEKATNFSLSTGATYFISHHTWTVKNPATDEDELSSEEVGWINFRISGNWGKYILLKDSGEYDYLKSEKKEMTGNFYFSYNHYYGSEYDFLNRLLQHIFSAGIGYAKINNYSILDKKTLQEGIMVLNEGGSKYQTVVKSTSGRVGEYKDYEGFSAFSELFWPIIKRSLGSIYLGGRYTYFNAGNSRYAQNSNIGLYFNFKDSKKQDVVNFSIVALEKRFHDPKAENTDIKKQYLTLQLAVPLSFL